MAFTWVWRVCSVLPVACRHQVGRLSTGYNQINFSRRSCGETHCQCSPLWRHRHGQLAHCADCADQDLSGSSATTIHLGYMNHYYLLYRYHEVVCHDSLRCRATNRGNQAEDAVDAAHAGTPPSPILDVIDGVFSCCFAIELATRLAAERASFYVSDEKAWNMMDTRFVSIDSATRGLGDSDQGNRYKKQCKRRI